eukprot:scaffold33715_cov39-Cyclotella_meneghiniana.AAC.4
MTPGNHYCGILWLMAHIRIMETEFNEVVNSTMRNILNKTNLTKVMKSILTRKMMIWISHLVIL